MATKASKAAASGEEANGPKRRKKRVNGMTVLSWAKIMAATAHLECPVCHRLFQDHPKEEFIEHLREDVKIEHDIVPLTVESARRFGIGRRLLEHAIRYLEQRYGSQEAAAIELLKEEWKAGGE